MITLKQAQKLTEKSKFERVEMADGKFLSPARALMAKYNTGTHYAISPSNKIAVERSGLGSQAWITNQLLGTYGKEYIASVNDTMRELHGITYYNVGDLYVPTLCYFCGKWRVCAIADIIEKHPKLFQ